MSPLRLFLISLAITTVGLSTMMYVHRPRTTNLKPVQIADGVFITSQLSPDDITRFPVRRFRTIVDIRPDGEAKDQASSSEIEVAVKSHGKHFHYLPVPHESIPDKAVEALSDVLIHDEKPTLLYCRTGRRAVRTFALAQASQVDGPNADAILGMVKASGFTADDLKADIDKRVSHRDNRLPATSP